MNTLGGQRTRIKTLAIVFVVLLKLLFTHIVSPQGCMYSQYLDACYSKNCLDSAWCLKIEVVLKFSLI